MFNLHKMFILLYNIKLYFATLFSEKLRFLIGFLILHLRLMVEFKKIEDTVQYHQKEKKIRSSQLLGFIDF